MSEDILKQRRCGPFWCLPALQQPGLLKRHTFIAGSAVGFSLQSKADESEPTPEMAWFIDASSVHDGIRFLQRPGLTAWPHDALSRYGP
jgi:hypothetical protein